MGAERAKVFFNSMPMVLFWCLLLLLFIIGFFVYASLRKRWPLTAIHAGCILVLAGGMVGSEKGHPLVDRFLGKSSFTKGTLELRQGQSSNHVELDSGTGNGELLFTVRLKDAFIEYYDKPAIHIQFSDHTHFSVPAEVGKEMALPDNRGTVQVTKVYRNFKLKQVDGRMTPYEADESGSNPAYELVLVPDGKPPETFFVFERMPMHTMGGRDYRAEYVAPRMVKDYKSTLQVIEEGGVVKEATIEVNKPLYYGGYHFYQSTFAYDQTGPVSGISVSSSRGVWVVFVGYGVIFAGLVMQFGSKLLKGVAR
ncbi:MAG: cytochrome c biogenesis protein ResB [Planctomycetota bacterium]